MTYSDPLDREARVARDLGNQVPFYDCVDGTYGDEDDDYSDDEHAMASEHLNAKINNRQYIIYNKEAIDELENQ